MDNTTVIHDDKNNVVMFSKKIDEKTIPSQIEEAVTSRVEDDFRKKAASAFLKMLFELSDRQLDIAQREKEGKVKLVGWGTYTFPKDTKSIEEFKDWIERELLTKPNLNWLLKNVVLEGKKDETLNDLQAKTKQSPDDIGNNQWFYPLFDKLRSLGDKMSVQQLTVLALIAKAGTNGVTTRDMCKSMDTALSSIQRQLGRLAEGYSFTTSPEEKRTREGLYLIEEFEDPNNRKQKRWVLSNKGIKFFKQLNSVIVRYDDKDWKKEKKREVADFFGGEVNDKV
jgi:DNA-binding MarR family transcriptional regulator